MTAHIRHEEEAEEEEEEKKEEVCSRPLQTSNHAPVELQQY